MSENVELISLLKFLPWKLVTDNFNFIKFYIPILLLKNKFVFFIQSSAELNSIFLNKAPAQLSTEQRAQAIMMLEKGYSTREIVAKVGCKSHTTIVRLKKKYEETGKVQNKPVQAIHVNDDIEVSTSTVRRALNRNGLAAQVKRKKLLLSKKHRKKCLNFAKRYKDWTVSDWNKVVWSDESKFQIFGLDGHQYCWKRPKDPLQDVHVKPTVKFGGGSIFVWGCFTSSGVGYLVRIEGGLDAELYCKILEEDLMGTLHYYDLDTNDIIFQQDNDSKHTATQHLWNDIDRRLRALDIEIRGKDMLWEQISNVWNETALEACSKLIETMPRRINDVIKAKGGYT
ncbi:hypothetical protein RclHR1_17100003 [Rhizophagus clarus]|uniref:Transposase Tc1-like domain-containing protein n=1 Tax=Rhizophagus clarus TaxID=94130 RepID=A0A2Z6QY94_9GLOM|nr:hypothetical protein RclHR1_17100003 [Rhizophagus clarus]